MAGGGKGGGGGLELGDEPQFGAFAPTLHDCVFERLENPGKVRAFHWGTGPKSEEQKTILASWMPSVVLNLPTGLTVVEEPGLVLHAFDKANARVSLYFTDLDGWVRDAFRFEQSCSATGDVGPGRYGVIAPQNPANGTQLGGLLFSYSSPEPSVFLHPVGPKGIGPAPTVMGDAAWLLRYYAPRLASVDTATGTTLTSVSPYVDGVVLEQGYATTSGPAFVFEKFTFEPSAGTSLLGLYVTDGFSAPQPYLLPPPDLEHLLRPAFAHSHVGWLRGVTPLGINTYEKVEVWASPWSVDPVGLTPYYVADLPVASPGYAAGGEGWYATPLTEDSSRIFHLATGQHVDVTAEVGVKPSKPLGITGGHAYFVMVPAGKNELLYILRRALPPL